MKKFLLFLVIFSVALTVFTYGIEYINNHTYNQCMIKKKPNCEDVYRIDN
jgi:hypothetical protein